MVDGEPRPCHNPHHCGVCILEAGCFADLDDDLAAGSWRLMEERFYQEGIVANLAYKRVTTYTNSHSTTVDAETLYYYGYDQVGNVVFVSEDTDMSTSKEFVFHQDAFGNELNTGVFASSS